MPATPLRRLAVLTVALVAVGASAAPAATSRSFKGKTSQNRTITFKVSGGKVRAFSAGVNVMCVQEGLSFNAVIPPRPLALKGGRFSYTGRDVTDGTNIAISGTVRGAKATGRVRMTDSRYNAADQTFDSCVGSATFTARAR